MKTVNIIGAGNVGKTIGKLLFCSNKFKINNILNSSYESSKNASNFIGQGTPIKSIKDLKLSDIILITTKDEQIPYIINNLKKNNKLYKDTVIIQCSGILSSKELIEYAETKTKIISIHPLKSFADPKIAFDTFKDTYCAYDGNSEFFEYAKNIMKTIGAKIFRIDSINKNLYHFACSFSSNFLVTLIDIASKYLESSGIPKELSLELAINLASTSLDNMNKLKSTEKALTGPIKRQEIQTINRHLNALDNKKHIELYKTLIDNTLEISSPSIDEFKSAILEIVT